MTADISWEFKTNPNTPSLLVPRNLAWDFEIQNNDVINSIKSRKKRRSAKKMTETFEKHGLVSTISTIRDQKDFLRLCDFFIEQHKDKKHILTIKLNEHWLQNKLDQKRTAEKIEIRQNGKLVGMKMYSYDRDNFYLSYKATSKEIDNLCELGLLLDVISFERANELGYKLVKTGKGKNLFGLSLPLSLFSYKCTLGLKMRVPVDDEEVQISFLSNRIQAPFVILRRLNNIETLNYVHPDNVLPENLNMYTPSNYPISPIAYSSFLESILLNGRADD